MEELREQFEGIGEVRGYTFKQIERLPYAYIYEVMNDETGQIHYEVFKRKTVNKYDFVNNKPLDDMKVRYPKSNNFGIWAWSLFEYNSAKKRLVLLNKYELSKNQ